MGAGRKGLGDINYLAHARPQQLYSVPSVRTEALCAYAWEHSVIGVLRHEQALTAEAAQRFVDHIWPRITINFPRRPPGPPLLVVTTKLKPRASAEYDPVRHEIRCHPELLRRHVLVHELAHGFAPDDDHGRQFCRALTLLWQDAFAIARWHAMRLAAEHGIELAREAGLMVRRKGRPLQLSLMFGAHAVLGTAPTERATAE
jgi:hypothetical protein